MGTSDNTSRVRLLGVSAVIGLIIGLIIGLVWAWYVSPAFYSGGAYPNEMSESYQQTYAKSVTEAYLTTRDVAAVADRMKAFSPEQKVSLLAAVAKDFAGKGQTTEASMTGDLAATLKNVEAWPDDAIGAGLSAAEADSLFAGKLGMAPIAPQQVDTGSQTTEPPVAEKAEEGMSLARILLIGLVIIFAIVAALFLLTRIKPKRRPREQNIPDDMMQAADSGLRPLRQWVGTYHIGQDNYDESFTVETPESDFLGECGMGILDGFAGGTPKKVLAFDVWLFDKTDIRTLSVPVVSKFAFEDEGLRAKLPPESNPVLAAEGTTFNIETTALMVKAKIEEVAYGDGPPEMSYFTSLKVSLSAYLKADVDVSGNMPIPEEYA